MKTYYQISCDSYACPGCNAIIDGWDDFMENHAAHSGEFSNVVPKKSFKLKDPIYIASINSQDSKQKSVTMKRPRQNLKFKRYSEMRDCVVSLFFSSTDDERLFTTLVNRHREHISDRLTNELQQMKHSKVLMCAYVLFVNENDEKKSWYLTGGKAVAMTDDDDINQFLNRGAQKLDKEGQNRPETHAKRSETM